MADKRECALCGHQMAIDPKQWNATFQCPSCGGTRSRPAREPDPRQKEPPRAVNVPFPRGKRLPE